MNPSDIREAAYSHDLERLKYFVEVSNVDVNEANNMNGLTALHWAVKGDNLAGVEYLLSKGADEKMRSKDGKLPVEFAKSNQMIQLFGCEDKAINLKDVAVEEAEPSKKYGLEPILRAPLEAELGYRPQQSIKPIALNDEIEHVVIQELPIPVVPTTTVTPFNSETSRNIDKLVSVVSQQQQVTFDMFQAFMEESRRDKAVLMRLVETQQAQIDFLSRALIDAKSTKI